jgi:hypothetical protein
LCKLKKIDNGNIKTLNIKKDRFVVSAVFIDDIKELFCDSK